MNTTIHGGETLFNNLEQFDEVQYDDKYKCDFKNLYLF